MKLLQICNEFPPAQHGGIGSLTVDLAEHLADQCEHFQIAGIYPRAIRTDHSLPEVDHALGYPVCRINNPFLRFPGRQAFWLERWWFYRALKRHYRRYPWDIVLCDDYTGPLPWGSPHAKPLAVRLSGSNMVYDRVLGREGNAELHMAESRMLKAATSWIGVSQDILAKTTAVIPPSSSQLTTVLPNAIDCTRFTPLPGVQTIRHRVVFHNSVRPRKGIIELFEAMDAVFAEFPQAELHVVGGASNLADFSRELLGMIKSVHHERIYFHGHSERNEWLIRLLQSAHVACYPSQIETFGLAPVEAMALERPTIYMSTGPGPEIIRDGIDGFLCPPHDSPALAGTIMRVFRMSEGELGAIGKQARATVLERFDSKPVARRYADYLRSMLRQRSEGTGA